MPLLLRVDPHDLVAEVLVLAADVGEGVVDVVVGVLPGLGGRGGVPVPGRGVDAGVVHPVPLPVQDVVADLHVLEDLRRRERGGAGGPGGQVVGGEQQRPREHRRGGGASRSCSRCSGGRVRRGRRGRGRGSRRTRGPAASICSAESRLSGLSISVQWWQWSSNSSRLAQSAISIGPSGALTQVRTISPSLPWTSPVRRSRTWPRRSSPTQVWQMPIRQPKGRVAPASSPATRIGVAPSQAASTPLLAKRTVPPSPPPALAADQRLEALHLPAARGRPPAPSAGSGRRASPPARRRRRGARASRGRARRGRPGPTRPCSPVSRRRRSKPGVGGVDLVAGARRRSRRRAVARRVDVDDVADRVVRDAGCAAC